MGSRTGSANLPLHGGQVPRWLKARMERLGRVITEAVVLHHGRDGWLARMAHPFWFQSFGAVMGMDWHSSGITTSVLSALKSGLGPVEDELGIHVCGGRGAQSRKTPEELRAIGERTGLDGGALARTSRLVAKVDGCAVQDGYEIYLHGFVVADDGKWVVVQQGMNPSVKEARRYHWLSERVAAKSFVDAPHEGVEGPNLGEILNLTAADAAPARDAQLALLSLGPDRLLDECAEVLGKARQVRLPHLRMPHHHDVQPADVSLRRLHAAFLAAAERGPEDFVDLLATPGLGARTIQSLALVAEVIHGTPTRFSDPARFAMAHGGKDGHPFPVPLDVYDQTLGVLRDAVHAAKSLGNDDRLAALERLDREARRLERVASGESLAAIVAEERRQSPTWRGRTVMGRAERSPTRPRGGAKRRKRAQLELF